MASYRYPREPVWESFLDESFYDFSIPSRPFVGHYEDSGRSTRPTTTSADNVISRCYPLEHSGIPNTNPFDYTVRASNNNNTKDNDNNYTENRMDDYFSFDSSSPVRRSYFDFQQRCDRYVTNNESQYPNFNDASHLLRNESRFFQESGIFGTEFEFGEDPLLHAYSCKIDQCTTMCKQLKRLFFHARSCTRRGMSNGDKCESCQWIGFLFQMHVQVCQKQNCPLPFCNNQNRECTESFGSTS
eukprot:g6557.t1